MKVFEKMTRRDLEKLHGHLAEAHLLMAKYCQEDTTKLELAAVCKPFADCLHLGMAIFSEICKRVKKGEQYEV